MSSILRITVNSRKRLFQRDVKIGVCHEFKGEVKQECLSEKMDSNKTVNLLHRSSINIYNSTIKDLN